MRSDEVVSPCPTTTPRLLIPLRSAVVSRPPSKRHLSLLEGPLIAKPLRVPCISYLGEAPWCKMHWIASKSRYLPSRSKGLRE